MKISIGADHGGVELRTALVQWLESEGHTVTDHGTFTEDSVDYPDYAAMVGHDVASGKSNFGVLICRTGVGVCISANKIKGVRAAAVHNEDDAHLSREHNNANVICFGASHEDVPTATRFLQIFLSAQFEGGRHERRVDKITHLEQENA